MKNTITFGVLLFSLLVGSAYGINLKGEIKGIIADDNGPLTGATISLLAVNADDNIQQVFSDERGEFSFLVNTATPYILSVSFTGYKDYVSDTLHFEGGKTDVQLGTVVLEMDNAMLDAVEVTGSKRLVNFSNGKVHVNIEDNPMVKGETVYSLMQKLPGVSVSHNGDISMRGKSGVQVMVNGRKMELQGEDLETYLSSLSSDVVATIEIDASPSAEHEAEGVAGIINISLKKNVSQGLVGSLSAGYTYQDKNLFNGNLYLSKRSEKLDWSVILDVSERGYTRRQSVHSVFGEDAPLESLEQSGREYFKSRPLFAQMDLGYRLSKSDELGVNLQGGKKKYMRDWNSESWIFGRGSEQQDMVTSLNNHQEVFDFGVMGAYYSKTLDTLGSNFKLSLDGSVVAKDIQSDFLNNYQTAPDEHYLGPASNSYQIWAAKADYKKQFLENISLKAGLKYSEVYFKSQLDFFKEEGGEEIFDPERSSSFNYKERIGAAYFSIQTVLHPKWTLESGLRIEKTWGGAEQQAQNTKQQVEYLDWFPNISLYQNISDSYQIEYGYNRRITRPMYDLLNPQIFYIDPYNYAEGNPDLKPQRTNSFSMNHNIKNTYQIGLSFDYITGYMAEVPMTDSETSRTSFSSRNLKNAYNYNLSAYAPITISKFWQVNNSLVLSYQSYKLDWETGADRENKHLFALYQQQQQIKLPKGVKLNIDISARSPFVYGYYRLHGQVWSDMAVSKSFMEDKLDVSVKVSDVFKSTNVDVEYSFNQNESSMKQYMGTHAIGLSLRYKFGGKNGQNGKKQSSFEEYNRIQQ